MAAAGATVRRRGGTLPSRTARVDCVGGVPRSRLLFACRSIERACSTEEDSQLFATAGLLAAVHLRTTGVVGAVRRVFRELRRHTGPPDPGRSRPVQESAATLWPGPDWAGRGPLRAAVAGYPGRYRGESRGHTRRLSVVVGFSRVCV